MATPFKTTKHRWDLVPATLADTSNTCLCDSIPHTRNITSYIWFKSLTPATLLMQMICQILVVLELFRVKWSHCFACSPEWTSAASIAPAVLLDLLRYLLSQPSRAPLIDGLQIWYRGLLSLYHPIGAFGVKLVKLRLYGHHRPPAYKRSLIFTFSSKNNNRITE